MPAAADNFGMHWARRAVLPYSCFYLSPGQQSLGSGMDIETGKKTSNFRRWSRVVVWTAFTVIVFVRYGFFRDRFEPPPRQRVAFQQPGRFQRPPTQVRAATSEVPSDLWRIQIEIGSRDVQKLRGYWWQGQRGSPQGRPEVFATVREGGVTYTNVAIHLKGAAGSFRHFDDKPALTLNFSKHANDQQFHGYTKISLNNSVQDPSYLSEALTREMFDAADVPVPRADHATVLINGRDLGLYVLTEGFGKTFLKRYFKNVKGNLYDSGFVQDINGDLGVNSGDHPDDRAGLERLITAATTPAGTNQWQRLNEVLDMDRFITFLALEMMTCHWDGYALNRNNYRVFHDLETDRMVFMPHGLDQMFGWPQGRFSVEAPIDPARLHPDGMVARAVLNTPQGYQLYFKRLDELQANIFDEERLTKRLGELAQRIRPTLASYDLEDEHDRAVSNLRRRMIERTRIVKRLLTEPRQSPQVQEPIQFDRDGSARLSNWRPHTGQQGGTLRFNRTDEKDGSLLHVTANRGGGVGSWRSSVLLGRGRYRFEGRARVQGVVNGGVCLRISGTQVGPQSIAAGEWVPLQFQFSIAEPVRNLVLVCELSAPRGEAWFDVNSLRLVRE